MMVVYILVAVGRIQDIVPGLHVLPVAKIVAALAIIIALQNRSTLASTTIWSLRPAKYTIVFMGLVVLSMAFSVLKHATFGTIKGTALSVCVGLTLLIKSARNWKDVRRLLMACVLASAILALSAEVTSFAGRAGYTHDLDPNDFAFVMDALLPFSVTFALVSRRFKRVWYIGLSLWLILEILHTESRGGLLGLICIITMLIILLPGRQRGQLQAKASKTKIAGRVIIIIIAAIIAWHVIPDSARARFETLRHPDSGYNANLNDPTGRFSIWLQTLPLSVERPWGWGAGAFNTVDGKYGGGRYKAAHNMYLQALIELGFEGLALFLGALLSSVGRLRSEAFAMPEPTDQDGLERRAFARAMIASFTGLCVSGFFLAELYSQAIWTLVILSCLVGRSAATSDVNRPRLRVNNLHVTREQSV
jgi:O-antigen ligase